MHRPERHRTQNTEPRKFVVVVPQALWGLGEGVSRLQSTEYNKSVIYISWSVKPFTYQ